MGAGVEVSSLLLPQRLRANIFNIYNEIAGIRSPPLNRSSYLKLCHIGAVD
jgi:hypothetical protein